MLESFSVNLIVGTVLGFLAGLGIGGGSLLVLWLSFVIGMDPDMIRGINLLFFLPSAVISILFRWKQGVICWSKILPAMIAGCIAALGFSWLGETINVTMLKKLFGIVLITAGVKEICYRPRKFR